MKTIVQLLDRLNYNLGEAFGVISKWGHIYTALFFVVVASMLICIVAIFVTCPGGGCG